jgi:hypothetical protein
VRFPVSTGTRITPLIDKGQEVRVVGRLADSPAGKVIDASSITNVANRETINVASVSPPSSRPPPSQPTPSQRVAKDEPKQPTQAQSGNVVPPGKSQGTTTLTGAELTSKEGRVNGYTTTTNGDMDGILLDTGHRVRFPVHVGKALLPLVQQGQSVRVVGWELTTPQGTILEATKITATPSGQTVDIASIPLPRESPKTNTGK